MYEMFEFLHGAHYAICVDLKFFYFFCFGLEVFCIVSCVRLWVRGVVVVGWW